MPSTDNPAPTPDEYAELAPAPDGPAQPEPEPQAEPVQEPQAEPVQEPQAEPVQEAQAEPVQEPQRSAASQSPHAPAEPGMFDELFDNPPESPLPPGYYTEDGVPTFDAVRERIEQRTATADGQDVLDAELPTERTAREEREQREKAGADRLAALRKSMGMDQ